jgi:hypothetical protein
MQAHPLKVNYLYLGQNQLTSLAPDLVDWKNLDDFQLSGKFST